MFWRAAWKLEQWVSLPKLNAPLKVTFLDSPQNSSPSVHPTVHLLTNNTFEFRTITWRERWTGSSPIRSRRRATPFQTWLTPNPTTTASPTQTPTATPRCPPTETRRAHGLKTDQDVGGALEAHPSVPLKHTWLHNLTLSTVLHL